MMIGDFRFEARPCPDTVAVYLFWDDDARMGRVIVPDKAQQLINASEGPDTDDLPLISAIAYGLTLAGMTDTRLSLTGDRTVWNEHWGNLKERAVD